MTVLLIFLFFFFLLLLPFIPGIMELLKPRDSASLSIKMDYKKDPRYFGKFFKNLIETAVPADNLTTGIKKIRLSKEENIEVTNSIKIPAYKRINHILYIKGDIITEEDVQSHKEIFSTGNVCIGRNSIVRAIASKGNISLSHGVNVIRWIDAEGDIVIHKNVNLGVCASSNCQLTLSSDCNFRRLYGNPVIVSELKEDENSGLSNENDKGIVTTAWIIDKRQTIIPPFTKVEEPLIIKNALTIRKNSTIKNSIKVYGNLLVEEDVEISGNIFAEKDIKIDKRAFIQGNIFSQSKIYLGRGVKVGRKGGIKSVIGKKAIFLDKGVKIYGYIMTEGDGRTG